MLTPHSVLRKCTSCRSRERLGNARDPAERFAHRVLSLRMSFSLHLQCVLTDLLWNARLSPTACRMPYTIEPHGTMVSWSLVFDIRHPLQPSLKALRLYVAGIPRHRVWGRFLSIGFPTKLRRVDRIARVPGFD